MRKTILSGLLLLWPLVAFSLSLCDYRAPETSLIDMKLSFAYHYLEDPDRPGIEVNAGNVSFTYSQIYSAPESGFSLAATGIFGLENFALAEALTEISGTYRYYLGTDEPVFLFGGFESRWRTDARYLQPWVQAMFGLGYGRFNDVTPLAKAFLIEEDLLRLGAIPASLSEDALMAIAQEIGRMLEYEKIEDLVAKVEQIVETDAGVDLNARAVLAVEDRITEVGRERFCGGALQAGIGYEILDPERAGRDIVLNASADWAVAPEPHSQLLVRSNLSAPLPWKDAYRFTIVATYDYEINGRTSFSTNYSLEWLKVPEDATPEDRHAAVFQLSLNLGGWDISILLSFTKGPGDVAWTQEFSISAAIDLR
ncbi:hypothetical protein ACVNPS_05630 [Candidatus Bipolaricaulota sp. J31]